MARFNMSGLDSVIDEMRKYHEESGVVCDAMLMTGAEEVKLAWQRAAYTHGLIDTGEMYESIGYPNMPTTIGNSRSIDIYPRGRDHKGVRNAEKAFILNYGTSKFPATNWVDTADAYCEETVVDAMIKVWEDYINNGYVNTAKAAMHVFHTAGLTMDKSAKRRDYKRRRR